MRARTLRVRTILAACAAAALAGPAQAQIALPTLPSVGGLTERVGEIAEPAVGRLSEARRGLIRDLLRANRAVLEADPAGQPIVRGRVLAVAPSPAALERALAAGFEIDRQDDLEGVGALVALRAPPGVSTRRALALLRRADPEGVYDFDHLHLPSGPPDAPARAADDGAGGGQVRIGLVDGGVSLSGPLRGRVLAQQSFAGAETRPDRHAEAVGALLAQDGASLVVADIYGGEPTGGASSALARALSWLARQGTPVINVSLVGPRNRVVEAMVNGMIERGFILVAAVGNDGPAAAPLYPASYEGVVGVTGVDGRGRVLIEAGRGRQVDFAALGVAAAGRGTSYAAPVAARLLAEQHGTPSRQSAQTAQARLRAAARDLGAPGRDDIYGAGLVGADTAAAAR